MVSKCTNMTKVRLQLDTAGPPVHVFVFFPSTSWFVSPVSRYHSLPCVFKSVSHLLSVWRRTSVPSFQCFLFVGVFFGGTFLDFASVFGFFLLPCFFGGGDFLGLF